MAIFGFGHRHLSSENLNEYLDGRLRAQASERLERAVADCADCRRSLEGLRAVSAALRRLPLATPPRSFVMAAPPLEEPRSASRDRSIPIFRVPQLIPQWTYAGAASLAALALAVLVSLDATGLVAPALSDTSSMIRDDTTSITAEPESATADSADAAGGAAGGVQSEAPRQQAAAESVEPDSVQPEAAAAAEAPPVAELAAAAPAAAESQPQEAQIAEFQAAAGSSGQPEQAAQSTAAESAPVQLEQTGDQKAGDRTGGAQPETAEVQPLPTPISNQAAPRSAQAEKIPAAAEGLPGPDSAGTPLVWRILEGAAAALFLLLAAAFILGRRAARRF